MQEWVQDTLQEKIIDTRPLSGVGVAKGFIVSTPTTTAVVKTYDNPVIVQGEIAGLRTIQESNSFQTPNILAHSQNSLLLEFIEHGEPLEVYWLRFAKKLHQMHQNTSSTYGFSQTTFCGHTPQDNETTSDWADFFTRCRLEFLINKIQLDRLTEVFDQKKEKITNILSAVKEAPSLVHGDLWGGNHICNTSQIPYLIDPSVYYGHRETDVAMMKLFGGFHETTFRNYNELWPLEKGWEEREKIYQLYHILNHAFLFGGHYIQSSIQKLLSI